MFNVLAQEAIAATPSVMVYGIALLVLVAVVLGASSLFNFRNLSLKKSLRTGFGSLVWASPVIAVLVMVAARVVPHFQFGSSPTPSSNTAPDWLGSIDGMDEVMVVEAFPMKGTHSKLDLETVSAEELPDWVNHKVQRLQSNSVDPNQALYRVTLESGVDWKDWQLSETAARESVAKKAAQLLQTDFQHFFSGNTKLPIETIQKQALCAELVTTRTFSKDDNPFSGYKVYWQIELSPEVRQHLAETWKQEKAIQRTELLCAVMAFLTLIAGSLAAFFHLDKKTNGNNRFRLKLASTALMTAGGLGLLAVLSQSHPGLMH